MDLIGAGGVMHFSVHGWRCLLRLARLNGWQPLGTRAPCARGSRGRVADEEAQADWSGRYDSNEYQVVTEEDAANIAHALAKGLDDLPDHDALGHECQKAVPISSMEELVELARTRSFPNPIAYFSGPGKRRVRDFIAYCRAGSFYIG